jgi:hypothetical protein
MTTIEYKVTMNHSEMEVYSAALEMLIKECKDEITKGANIGWVVRLKIATRMYESRYQRAQVTSEFVPGNPPLP